jgi:MBG domain (YGX type)
LDAGNTLSPLAATLTANGNPVSGKTISFTLNGTGVGTATTNSNGVATLVSVSSLTGINAGTYPAAVAASFAQDGTYAGQTASNSLTVSKKAASVTPAAASKTYGAADPGFMGTLSGFLAADGVTASYSHTAGETVAGGPYRISATLAPMGMRSRNASSGLFAPSVWIAC